MAVLLIPMLQQMKRGVGIQDPKRGYCLVCRVLTHSRKSTRMVSTAGVPKIGRAHTRHSGSSRRAATDRPDSPRPRKKTSQTKPIGKAVLPGHRSALKPGSLMVAVGCAAAANSMRPMEMVERKGPQASAEGVFSAMVGKRSNEDRPGVALNRMDEFPFLQDPEHRVAWHGYESFRRPWRTGSEQGLWVESFFPLLPSNCDRPPPVQSGQDVDLLSI